MEAGLNKYNVWKTDLNGNHITDSDRILIGSSKRWILNHISSEENIKPTNNPYVVRLANGDMWFAEKI